MYRARQYTPCSLREVESTDTDWIRRQPQCSLLKPPADRDWIRRRRSCAHLRMTPGGPCCSLRLHANLALHWKAAAPIGVPTRGRPLYQRGVRRRWRLRYPLGLRVQYYTFAPSLQIDSHLAQGGGAPRIHLGLKRGTGRNGVWGSMEVVAAAACPLSYLVLPSGVLVSIQCVSFLPNGLYSARRPN